MRFASTIIVWLAPTNGLPSQCDADCVADSVIVPTNSGKMEMIEIVMITNS
jgi:hypothetical protein